MTRTDERQRCSGRVWVTYRFVLLLQHQLLLACAQPVAQCGQMRLFCCQKLRVKDGLWLGEIVDVDGMCLLFVRAFALSCSTRCKHAARLDLCATVGPIAMSLPLSDTTAPSSFSSLCLTVRFGS